METLNKEDISLLGWKQMNLTSGENFILKFERRSLILGVQEHNWISIFYKEMTSDFYIKRNTRYSGVCPSINDLKYLMKLLQIN